MGNAGSREAEARQSVSLEGEEHWEGEEKLRTLAALSSRVLAASGDSVGMEILGGPQPSCSPASPTRSGGPKRPILSANVKEKELEEIPEIIFDLKDLQILDVSQNRIRRLPEALVGLRRLKRLALGSNNLTEIPDFIARLQSLNWLDFTHNHVHTVSDDIAFLPNLASLGASDCRLTSFPIGFCRLPNLRKLGVFNNMITSLPAEIGNLVHLTKLDLSGNALTSLPKEIGLLTELTWLNLSKNMLESLPEEIGQLTKLKELGLSFNRLKRLPDMSRLTDLSLLPVYNNELEVLDDWILEMTSLVKLDVSFNKLTRIPDCIFQLPKLTFINLRKNELTRLPPYNPSNLNQQSNILQSIDVRNNQLQHIPISLLGSSLQDFKCSGNPFVSDLKLKHPNAYMSLRDIALNVVVQYDRPVSYHTSPMIKARVEAARQSAPLCPTCRRPFLQGFQLLNLVFVETSDAACVPFLVETCSADCSQKYRHFSSALAV